MRYQVGDTVKVKAYRIDDNKSLCISKNGTKLDYETLLEVVIIGIDENSNQYLIDLTGRNVIYPRIKEGVPPEFFKQFSIHPKNYNEEMIICRVDEFGVIARVKEVEKRI